MKPATLCNFCRYGLLALIFMSALAPLGDGFANATRGVYAVGLVIALVLYWKAREEADNGSGLSSAARESRRDFETHADDSVSAAAKFHVAAGA